MALKRGILFASMLAVVVTGTAIATHTSVGLSSTLLGRGSGDRATLAALVAELGSMHALGTSDVAVVRATLAAGGTTDWHGHPGPSIVVVTAGTIQVVEPGPGGRCIATDHPTGSSFFHGEGAHTFVNTSTAVAAEFLVVYFVPAGPLLVHEPSAAAC